MPKSQKKSAQNHGDLKSQGASEIPSRIASKYVEKEGRNRSRNRNDLKSLQFQIASGLDLKSLAIWASQ